jgi:hypothetical protein
MTRTKQFFCGLLTGIVVCLPLLLFGQNPAPLGPYGNLGFVVSTISTQTPTLTANQMLGETNFTFAGAVTPTTDTAANICSMFPFVGNPGAGVGYAYDWYERTSGAGGSLVIPTAGTGVTIVGLGTAATLSIRHWKVVLNTCPVPGTALPAASVTMFSLETSTV